jgi:hypothetical protein
MITLTTGVIATAALTIIATMTTATVIGQEDTGLEKITTASQNTSSPPSVNLAPSTTMTNSTRRSSTAYALYIRTPNTR